MDDDIKYSVKEGIEIENALTFFKIFKALSVKSQVATLSPFASSTIGRNSGERMAWGTSEIVVRAGVEEVLAFMWQFSSRARRKANDLEKTVVKEFNSHYIIAYTCKAGVHKGVLKLLPREGLSSFIWKRIDKKTVVFAATPTTHDDKPLTSERVRGEVPFVIRIEKQANDMCKLTYCICLEMGAVPNLILDFYLAKFMQVTELVQQYFQKLRLLKDLDVDDGKAMAEALVAKYSKKEKQEAKESKHSISHVRVHSVTSSHVALKQYGDENLWFRELMIGIVSNELLGSSGVVNSRLLTLSEKEGRTIGNSLASILMSSTSPDLAVEEWILTFRATQELDKTLIWFHPMMDRCAMRLLAKVAWGAKFRLYTGAALSIMDLVRRCVYNH